MWTSLLSLGAVGDVARLSSYHCLVLRLPVTVPGTSAHSLLCCVGPAWYEVPHWAFSLLMLLAPPPGTVISGAACLSNSSILSPLEIARDYVVHGWLKQMLFLLPWSLISSKEDKLDNKQLCNSNQDKCRGVPKVMSPKNTRVVPCGER